MVSSFNFAGNNPYASLLKTVNINGEELTYFDLPQLNDPRYGEFKQFIFLF